LYDVVNAPQKYPPYVLSAEGSVKDLKWAPFFFILKHTCHQISGGGKHCLLAQRLSAMRYMLILQFATGQHIDAYDELVEYEELLDDRLYDVAQVDGHDSGSGQMNIFIRTNEPYKALQIALPLAPSSLKSSMKAAFRESRGETYTVIYPPDATEFKVL
jgi:hypothetical protein